MTTEVPSFLSGQRLLLPVYNRFDHTDLNEIKIRYTYKGVEKELPALFHRSSPKRTVGNPCRGLGGRRTVVNLFLYSYG